MRIYISIGHVKTNWRECMPRCKWSRQCAPIAHYISLIIQSPLMRKIYAVLGRTVMSAIAHHSIIPVSLILCNFPWVLRHIAMAHTPRQSACDPLFLPLFPSIRAATDTQRSNSACSHWSFCPQVAYYSRTGCFGCNIIGIIDTNSLTNYIEHIIQIGMVLNFIHSLRIL